MKYLESYKGGASRLAPEEGYLVREMLEVMMNGTNTY
jgi:hypothetical protein